MFPGEHGQGGRKQDDLTLDEAIQYVEGKVCMERKEILLHQVIVEHKARSNVIHRTVITLERK